MVLVLVNPLSDYKLYGLDVGLPDIIRAITNIVTLLGIGSIEHLLNVVDPENGELLPY